MATAARQKELKAKYLEIVEKEVYRNDPKMIDFLNKEISQVVELSNGDLVAIDKPRIEKSFCFGYSDSMYDTEDYDRANEMARYASESQEYFKSENMKQLTKELEHLEKGELYTRVHYYNSPKDSKVKKIVFCSDIYHYWNLSEEQRKEYTKITGNDLEIVKAAYLEEIAKFEKRLDSYLKRYGMEHIKTWSYWRDA